MSKSKVRRIIIRSCAGDGEIKDICTVTLKDGKVTFDSSEYADMMQKVNPFGKGNLTPEDGEKYFDALLYEFRNAYFMACYASDADAPKGWKK